MPLPAGTAPASPASKEDSVCFPSTGSDAWSCLGETVRPGCTCCVIHLDSLPSEKGPFHRSEKDRDRRSCGREDFQERERINTPEEGGMSEWATWRGSAHQHCCHPDLRHHQMKDACLGLPKTANCREIASRAQVSKMHLAEH